MLPWVDLNDLREGLRRWAEEASDAAKKRLKEAGVVKGGIQSAVERYLEVTDTVFSGASLNVTTVNTAFDQLQTERFDAITSCFPPPTKH